MFKNLKFFLPSFNQSLLIVALLILAGGLGMGMLMAVIYGIAGIPMADANPLLMYVAQFIPPFIYIWYMGNQVARENGRLMEKGLFDRISPAVPLSRAEFGQIKPVVTALLTAVATFALMVVLEPTAEIVPMPNTVKEVYKQMFTNMLWTSLSVAVAAPLAEEFILRGVILRGMLHNSTPLKAILWSAFYFAFIHLNLYQAIGAFIMGLFMGWIYYRTGSLWLTILVHFINNGSSLLFTILNPQLDVETTLIDIIVDKWCVEGYIAIYTISLAILAGIIYFLYKKLGYAEIKKTISA